MSWRMRLAALVEAYCGVRLSLCPSPTRLAEVVEERRIALQLPDHGSYVAYLESSPSRDVEFARLADRITTGHSEFFRDPRQLAALSRLVFEGGRPCEVWSAGCATGEEPYSLAMLAADGGSACRILATDINTRFLERAAAAVYAPECTTKIPPERRTHFEEVGGRLRVRPLIRNQVTFRRHNLVELDLPFPPTSPGWDLIVCRNVLIYFDRERVDGVVARLVTALRPGGWLVLGAADPFCGHVGGSVPQCVDGHVFYQRNDASTAVSIEAPRLHQPPAAASTLQEADPEAEPHDSIAALSRGNLRLGAHDFPGALREYDGVIQREPLIAEAHYLRGLTQRKMGEYPAAKVSFRRALFLDPRFWPAAYLLGSCLEREGRHALAHARFRQVLDGIARSPHSPLRSRIDGLAGLELRAQDVAAACRRRLKG